MKKVAIILCGCGAKDGSEIHEATLCLLAFAKRGIEYQCFAPNNKQRDVINHLTDRVDWRTSRETLVESARIARGNVLDVYDIKIEDYDGLVIPGGFGVMANTSNYYDSWNPYVVDYKFECIVRNFHVQNKPIMAVCIAPFLVSHIVRSKVTIGDDSSIAKAIKISGSTTVDCEATDIVVDKESKVVTTPGYMLCKNIYEVYQGIEKAVDAMIAL